MKDQNETPRLDADLINENRQPAGWPGALTIATILAATVFCPHSASAQTVPVLTIAPAGTNQFEITFTNSIGTLDYDLLWTPELANPNYPWSFAAIGTPGGTNFIVNCPMGDTTGFFRAVLDTNAVPLWEAANPANPASAILQVYIYGPSNGAVLQ